MSRVKEFTCVKGNRGGQRVVMGFEFSDEACATGTYVTPNGVALLSEASGVAKCGLG